MPLVLIDPTCATLETHPEIPREIMEQLQSFDPPPRLTGLGHPVACLLRDRWNVRGCDRKEAARCIAVTVNYDKTMRRIDQHLVGDRYCIEWVQRLAKFLDLSPDELAAAQDQIAEWERDRLEYRRRRTRHWIYKNNGPYLQAIPVAYWRVNRLNETTKDWPNVPEVLQVRGSPMPEDLSAWMSACPNVRYRGAPVVGYLYMSLPEDVHFFSADGSLVAKGNSALPPPEGFDEYHGPSLPPSRY